MKLSRITSFVFGALALLLILSQGISQPAAASSFASQATQGSTDKDAKPDVSTQHPTDQAPYHLPVQGRLTNAAGNPITIATNVTFNLYTALAGGNAIFSEGPVSVTPNSNGLFTYQLGSATPLDAHTIESFRDKLYLGITVGSDTEMTPRIELALAPYAASLVPGALVRASLPESNLQIGYGVINGINDDYTDPANAGLYGKGAIAVYGISDNGDGISGLSLGHLPSRQSAGVVGVSLATTGTGGVFTDTALNGSGVVGYGQLIGVNGIGSSGGTSGGYGVTAEGGSNGGGSAGDGILAFGGNNSGNDLAGDGLFAEGGSSTALHLSGAGVIGIGGPDSNGNNNYGGLFESGLSSSTTIYANGHVDAYAYDTHTSYDLVVEYHGSEPLHPGDVLAFDGNNHQVHGEPTIGVVKATSDNADLAMGVAEHPMYWVDHRQTMQNGKTMDSSGWHIDGKADTIQPGDTLSVVVLGQTQMKAPAAKFGARLTLASDGSLISAKAGEAGIGKVISDPDQDGYVTVFVNFK